MGRQNGLICKIGSRFFSELYRLPLNTLGFHLTLDAMPEELIDPIRKDVINGIRADLMVARGIPWASDWGVEVFL